MPWFGHRHWPEEKLREDFGYIEPETKRLDVYFYTDDAWALALLPDGPPQCRLCGDGSWVEEREIKRLLDTSMEISE